MERKYVIRNIILLIYCHICIGNESVIKESGNDCRETLYDISVPRIEELRDLVEKFFNKVMKVIQNADPYSSNHIDLKYYGYGIESEGYLNGLLVSGTSSIKLNKVEVDDNTSLQFTIYLTMKDLQFLGSFSLKFDLLTMLPIYGNGDLGIALSGLRFAIKTTLKELRDKRLQMTDFQLDYNVDNVKVDISSLFNSTNMGAYLSHVLSDILPVIINDTPSLKTYGNIGSMAALNMLMCNKGLKLSFIIEVMEKFIQ